MFLHFEIKKKAILTCTIMNNTRVEMDWKVITINVFYVQLLKVGFCSNDDKSVRKHIIVFFC